MKQNGIIKYVKIFILSLGVCLITARGAVAAEITAIDFNGNVIGQVISTGMVINANGENIGYITADSLIMNANNEIVGGVVPQGIAIGNDNKLLGKINSDGVVRSLTGKPLGKALPNGLVMDDKYNIIGAVLFPGLIYDSAGKTIGRLTGGGTYTNLDGKEIGFVSANGYAYKISGNEYRLDGRLMSSKMVVSLNGEFIGSIAPSGKVIDFEGKEIGNIHANEFVYSPDNIIIGRVVRSGYAFNLRGRYLGIITYNGVVVNGDEEVGRYRADGNIVDSKNEVIGFSVSFSATANDNNGRYLGRVVPNGLVLKGNETVGKVGAKGYIYNQNNEKIGNLNITGPVFDAMGNLSGQSMSNGVYISLKGSQLGRMKGRYAFDTNGMLSGGIVQDNIAINNMNISLGTSDIDGFISNSTEHQIMSPFGYLLNAENKVSGSSIPMAPLYGLEGLVYSYIDPNGNLYRSIADAKLSMTGILFGDNSYIAGLLSPRYALSFKGEQLGVLSNNNIIVNANGELAYKAVPGNYVVAADGRVDQNLMPVRGYTGENLVAVTMGGDLLGYSDNEGKIIDLNGNLYGRALYKGFVADNNKSVTGKLMPFSVILNDKCAQVGIMNGRGDIVNNRNVVVGRILANGQAVSDVGTYIGYSAPYSGLVDFSGNFAGTLNIGQGLDYEGKSLGCVNRHGVIVNGDNQWQYGVITPAPVIDFENKIIGQVLDNGSVVESSNQIIGNMQPNGNVISKSKKDIGNVMRYKVAFKNDNTFLGMVQNSGQIENTNGEIVGQINFDGSVQQNGETVGYALFDWYVYDENFIVYGYITKDGTVLNTSGSRVGKMDKGFVVDKNRQLVARGYRDYTIRDISHNPVGELQMDGNVLDYNNQNIGYLSENGSIRNTAGDEIAQAFELQYYVTSGAPADAGEKAPDWADYKQVQIQDEGKKGITQNIQTDGLNKRIVGIALNPDGDILGNIYDDNKVYDDNGNVIGFRTPDGMIVDMNYNPIGVEEVKNMSANNMFVPAGTFGSGNAYGIGSRPANLGPGGGYGQGERYDPARANALAQLQENRRSAINVGKIESTVQVSNFTGYEDDDWPGSNRTISTWRVDMSQMILQDKPIPAVLSRSVYVSDGFGDNIPVTAIVERNVYAEEGRNIIIPAGSRVIGSMGGENSSSGGTSGGAVKIGIQWDRLIRPDGSQFTLGSAQTADAQGRAGALGYLDEQLLKKYSRPLLLSTLENAAAYMIAAGEGSSTTDGGTTTESSKSQAASNARENFIEQMNEIFQEIVEDKSNIRAITYIPAGTRIIIFPNQDMWLNSEKRSGLVKNSNPDDGRGLTTANPENFGSRGSVGGGRSSGANVTYRGEYEEDIAPTGGQLLNESNTDNTRRRRMVPQQQVPPTIQQQEIPQNETVDDVPALL